MLRIRDLTSLHLRVEALDVPAGGCVAVTGPSGSGKSLLLRAVADLDPNGGEVTLDGVSRASLPAPEWRRRVALVPAESGWWAETVRDHFQRPDAAAGLVAALGLPADCLDWPVDRLSSGERHRLAIARALAPAPRALLLDEPTARLDPEAAAKVEALVRARLETGAPVLLTTHDADLARRLGARRLRMQAGRLSEAAPT